MSWVTIIWSMIASACLTLAAIYWLVWYRNRTARAHLFFSLTAAATTALSFFELWTMRAETPAELLTALAWAHVPLFVWLVSVTWFVWFYLGAGRRWLAWTITGVRAVAMLVNLLMGHAPGYRPITSLEHVQFLGESVNTIAGVPNRATPLAQFATLAGPRLRRRCQHHRVAARRPPQGADGGRERRVLPDRRPRHRGGGAVGQRPGADLLQPVLPGPGRGDGLRVEPRRAPRIGTGSRAAGERGRAARERGAHGPGRRCRRLRPLDPRPRAQRHLGEREVARVVWLPAVSGARTRRHPEPPAP